MNRTRISSAIAGLAIASALVVGVSTPASAAVKPYWSGTKSCGTNKMPNVAVNGRSGTVDIIWNRRGNTLDIKNATKDQNFRAPVGNTSIQYIVQSSTLTKAPVITCVPAPV